MLFVAMGLHFTVFCYGIDSLNIHWQSINLRTRMLQWKLLRTGMTSDLPRFVV